MIRNRFVCGQAVLGFKSYFSVCITIPQICHKLANCDKKRNIVAADSIVDAVIFIWYVVV